MSNRVKRVRMTSELLINMFRNGNESHVKCIKGLPDDARFIRMTSSEQIYGIDIVVSSESFSELKDGDEIPIFNDGPIFEDLTHLLPADWNKKEN